MLAKGCKMAPSSARKRALGGTVFAHVPKGVEAVPLCQSFNSFHTIIRILIHVWGHEWAEDAWYVRCRHLFCDHPLTTLGHTSVITMRLIVHRFVVKLYMAMNGDARARWVTTLVPNTTHATSSYARRISSQLTSIPLQMRFFSFVKMD